MLYLFLKDMCLQFIEKATDQTEAYPRFAVGGADSSNRCASEASVQNLGHVH